MKATTHLVRGVVLATFIAVGTAHPAAANGDEALPTLPSPISKMSLAQWDAFSASLQKALASEHDGLQIGAMRLALQYADYVDIKGSTVNLMRIYRNHSDDQVRRLAVVTLGSIDSQMITNYLRLHAAYESSPVVRKTIRAVIAAA